MIIDFRPRNPRQLKLDFDAEIPSFLRHEFEYMGNVSAAFPEDITPSIRKSDARATGFRVFSVTYFYPLT
jgi:hypothetical protein